MFVVRARSFELFLKPPVLLPASVGRPYHAVACHRFGWLDGVAVSVRKQLPGQTHLYPPISILLRAESDDPWSSDVHTLDLFTLTPDSSYTEPQLTTRSLASGPRDSADDVNSANPSPLCSPYIFPPEHVASFPSARGHLRCTDIRLGPHGTAVWIQPRPARNLDLTAQDVHSSDAQGNGLHPVTGTSLVRQEALVATLLPGVLKAHHGHEKQMDGEGVRSLWHSGGTWTSLDYDEARGMIALGDTIGVVTVLRLP